MNGEQTFKTFGELAIYAAAHCNDAGEVNTYDASMYWDEMVRWAADCAGKRLPPINVMVMETQIVQKQLLCDQGKPGCAVNGGHYATRLHRIELVRTMMKNAGFMLSRAAEGYVDAVVEQARPLKPVKPVEQPA